MIARSLQAPPVELPITLTQRVRGITARRTGLAFGLLGFMCFMPYIGFPVGNSTALQLGSFLSALMVLPFFFKPIRQSAVWIVLVLFVPLAASTLKVGLSGGGDLDVAMRTLMVWIIALITLFASQLYSSEYTLELLTGIAVATIIHALVGFYQLYCFQFGELPFVWLYVNQSFYSVQDNAETVAKYIQRPFGIFPEPSAMASSLAPYLLFWTAEMFGLVRLKRKPAFWQRVLFGIALVMGLSLVVISRSGHGAVIIVSIVLFVAIWFVRCRATARSFGAILLVFGAALPIFLYFAAESIGDRMGGKANVGNSSWEDRSNSLIFGYKLFIEGDLSTIIFGYGTGQTSPVLERLHGLEAVWSISLCYLYECGLLGIAAVLWVGRTFYRTARATGFNIPYIAIIVVWVIGVTLTTSYIELLSIWICFGWLSMWPTFCEVPGRAELDEPNELSDGQKGLAPAESLPKPKAKWEPLGWRTPSADVVAAAATELPSPTSEVTPGTRWSNS